MILNHQMTFFHMYIYITHLILSLTKREPSCFTCLGWCMASTRHRKWRTLDDSFRSWSLDPWCGKPLTLMYWLIGKCREKNQNLPQHWLVVITCFRWYCVTAPGSLVWACAQITVWLSCPACVCLVLQMCVCMMPCKILTSRSGCVPASCPVFPD